MKIGSLVRIAMDSLHNPPLALYEGSMLEGGRSWQSGEWLHEGETAVILETVMGYGNHIFHKILTPRGTTGWTYELRLEEVA